MAATWTPRATTNTPTGTRSIGSRRRCWAWPPSTSPRGSCRWIWLWPAPECRAPEGPCWGIFRSDAEISAGPALPERGSPEKVSVSSGVHPVWLARLLPLGDSEHYVFRAALFSIVLSLALGQNAALLCKAWCQDATPARCPHGESTTPSSMSADDRCEDAAADVAAFVREDAPRGGSASDAQNSAVVPGFRLTPPPVDAPRAFESGGRLLEARPLVISLRV